MVIFDYNYAPIKYKIMSTTEESSGVETLSFYTTGEAYTGLVRSLIEEGSFCSALEILKSGGLESEHIRKFFLYGLSFTGDTREDDGTLGVELHDNASKFELSKIFFYATSTCLKNITDEFNIKPWEHLPSIYRDLTSDSPSIDLSSHEYKDIKALSEVFSLEEINELIAFEALSSCGFTVNPDLSGVHPSDFSGVILATGDVVRCGFQQHRFLYPILCSLGYASSSYWDEDRKVIHITSGELAGWLSHRLRHPKDIQEDSLTPGQITTCFRIKDSVSGFYGYGRETIVIALLSYINNVVDHGGKYNNLTFLKTFYEFNLPKFSKERFENSCIRTSPKFSMAGILNSKFNVDDYDKAIEEIKQDFEKHKSLVGSYISRSGERVDANELHFFFQEYIEGQNGVCHFYPKETNKDEYRFSYSVSEKQGDVVQGIKSKAKLTDHHQEELLNIVSTIGTDLGNPIQLEFVANESGIHIVQLRLLENNPFYTKNRVEEKDILFKGKSFSSGDEVLSIDEVLVVDSDCDSESIIGKKALIVKEDIEFSHILALSKSLKIPSIYAVGDINLPEKFQILTTAKEGLILNHKIHE